MDEILVGSDWRTELFDIDGYLSVIGVAPAAQLDGRWWLCDPGFGFSLTGLIELADGAVRSEGSYTFGIDVGIDVGIDQGERDRLAEVVAGLRTGTGP